MGRLVLGRPGPVTHKEERGKERAAVIFLPRPVWEPSPPLHVYARQKIGGLSVTKAIKIGDIWVPFSQIPAD